MLQAFPTKYGTGITLYGDYLDFTTLYNTVHQIAGAISESNVKQKGQFQILMNFAYAIRTGYSLPKKEEKFEYGDGHSISQFGINLAWTDLLIYISVLRANAGYISTNKLNQSNLSLLEYITEKAMFEYDPKGAMVLREFIGQRINISDINLYLIYQYIFLKFVSTQSGKARFNSISDLFVKYFSENSREYKEMMLSFSIVAQNNNCEVTEVEINEYPEFKW